MCQVCLYSVGLEFIRLLMVPVRLPHPLQGAHRVAIAYRENDDNRYSLEYNTRMLQEVLDVLVNQLETPRQVEKCETS